MAKNNFWFKRRRYGYGWVPTTWQGVSVILVFLLVILLSLFLIKDVPENTFTKEVGYYLMIVFISAVIMIWISYKKGPQPKWRWGKKPTDNPDEDF